MQIRIRSLETVGEVSGTVNVDVEPGDTIDTLKRIIESIIRRPPEMQRLVFQGKPLADIKDLWSAAHPMNNDTVVFVYYPVDHFCKKKEHKGNGKGKGKYCDNSSDEGMAERAEFEARGPATREDGSSLGN